MASSYTVVSQRRTVQVLGGGDVLDVMEVGARTNPSLVYFQRQIPYSVWQSNSAGELLGPVADAINGRLQDDFIGGALYTQDVNASGLLVDVIEFTVWLPEDHAMTTTVAIPVELLAGTDTFVTQIVAQMFQDALTDLQATAAL